MDQNRQQDISNLGRGLDANATDVSWDPARSVAVGILLAVVTSLVVSHTYSITPARLLTLPGAVFVILSLRYVVVMCVMILIGDFLVARIDMSRPKRARLVIRAGLWIMATHFLFGLGVLESLLHDVLRLLGLFESYMRWRSG